MSEAWIQVFALFLANAGLIIWFRTESRNDWRHMDQKVEAIKDLISVIQLEMKDFHARLCSIEERNKK